MLQRALPGPPLGREAMSDGQDPRRQHLRRQRLGRGHRGLGDRPDRAVLIRHAFSLALGSDRQRRAAERAVDGRPPVLRDPVLPDPGRAAVYENSKQSIIRTRAVADGFHEEITVLNHDEKPFDLTLRLEAEATSPTSSRSRTRLRKRGSTRARSSAGAWCSGTGGRRSAKATTITAAAGASSTPTD